MSTPIYPLVVYHGKQKWKIPLNFAALVDIPNEWYAYVPEFNYDLQELSDFVGEDITDNVPLQTALLAMKHVFDPRFAGELPELLDKYSVLAQEQAAMEFLMTTLRYIASASPYITQEDMRRAIEHAFPPTIGGNIMQTLAQEWVQQGIQQGVQQGVQQTLLENIKTGLELRFGEQGLVFYQKINQSTDLAVLRSIFVALFKVAALEELQQTFNSSGAIAFRTAGQDQETNAN